MNQRNTSELKVSFILGQLVAVVVIFVVLHFGFPWWDIIYDILYWVGFLIVFIVQVSLELKLPLRSRKNTIVKYLVPIILSWLLIAFFVGYVHDEIYELRYPHFKIDDINYTWQYAQGYTYYARIRNEGTDGSAVVTCTVTRGDLTTVSKSQTVYLRHNEGDSISFFFSESAVGTQWVKYGIKIGS